MEYGSFKRRDGFRDRGGDFRDRERGENRDRDDRGGSRGGGFRDERSGGGGFRGGFRDDRGGGGFRGGGGGFRSGGGGGFRDRDDREAEESVFSKRVRAGKRRTYFFDVKKTRGDDYFITITESTRREDGYGYKRHKLFLYKEDFNRFVASLNEVVDHVKTTLMPDFDYEEFDRRQAEWEAQNRDGDGDEDFDSGRDHDTVSDDHHEEESDEKGPKHNDEDEWKDDI